MARIAEYGSPKSTFFVHLVWLKLPLYSGVEVGQKHETCMMRIRRVPWLGVLPAMLPSKQRDTSTYYIFVA